jgi:glycine/D-amino acid oxidase-like deaminating enzyme
MEKQTPYWLEVPVVKGAAEIPAEAGIVIIGSGLSGVSTGYFLQKQGFENIHIVDYKPEQAATFRNCGHILYGTVESMTAFSAIHGADKARELWGLSINFCNQVGETVRELGLKADYRQDGYLVIAVNESEDRECQESVKLLNSMDFQSDYWDAPLIKKKGFKNAFGGRFEKGSAQAHPVKFRNGVLQEFLKKGGTYSEAKVTSLRETSDGVVVSTILGDIKAEAAVIAGNAYSPLFSEFFQSRRLIEPFRGQIITSKPLKHSFAVKFPHSFDHGYEYALVTEDNRLMLGGWRNNSETKELGTYSLDTNKIITQGLKDFARHHYEILENLEWDYGWSGIMGASQTSLPFIGPTNSDRIYACAGYTGHGFSWAHGAAQLLAKIMAGDNITPAAKHFSLKHRT